MSEADKLRSVLSVVAPGKAYESNGNGDLVLWPGDEPGTIECLSAVVKDDLAQVVAMLSFEQRVKFNTHMEIEVWNRDSDGVVIDREWWPRSPFDTITAPASTWLDALCAATLTSASGQEQKP